MLADRYFSNNRWWLLTFTSGILLVSIALLSRLTSHSPYWLIAVVMICFGFSAAASWGILCTLVGDVVGLSAVATATAIIFFVTNIMDGGGPVLFGYMLKTTQSYQSTFGIYVVISAIAMFIFLWMALRNRLAQTSS
jgi:predicted MFS family arabinose efflux permease